MDTFSAVTFFGALFAIMNPFSNLPIFLSVTEGASDAVRRSVAIRVAALSCVMGAAIAVSGDAVLNFFGIGVDDFRVAGGLVVLLIGLGMLNGSDSSAHHGTDAEKTGFAGATEVAFYPLAFPMLVGPGTITTLILYAQQVDGGRDMALYAGVFAAVVAILLVVFLLGSALGRHLTATARSIMTRLMGMILAAIAVEMIASGLKALLPGLA